MRRTTLTALFAAAMLSAGAVITAPPVVAQEAAAPAHPDAAAVRAWLEEYEASWAASDGERMYANSTDDLEWINIVGMHWRGKAEVVQAHVAYLTTMFRGVPMELIGVESIRSVGDDALVVVAHWRVGQFTTPTGHIVPPSEDRMTLVFERTAEGLRLAHGANVQIDPVAARSNPVQPAAGEP